MYRVDVDILQEYIRVRKDAIFRRIVAPRLDEDTTEALRGRYAELLDLQKAIENNFAIPEGRNE